jgi:hypothetical protein
MARIRTIKPEITQSESLGKVCRDSRLLFILMITLADDAGRLRGHPLFLARVLFPFDCTSEQQIIDWLEELENAGSITRYEVDGNSYAQLNNWLRHQRIDRPTPSRLPGPLGGDRSEIRQLASTRELSPQEEEGERTMTLISTSTKEEERTRCSQVDEDALLTFPVDKSWRPSAHFDTQVELLGFAKPSAAELETQVREFIAYWVTRPTASRTQRDWDHALAKRLARIRLCSAPKRGSQKRVMSDYQIGVTEDGSLA